MLVKRGNTWVIDTRVGGKRIRISTRTSDKAEAERLLPTLLAHELGGDMSGLNPVARATVGVAPVPASEAPSTASRTTIADGFAKMMEQDWADCRDPSLRTRIQDTVEFLGAHLCIEDITYDHLHMLQRHFKSLSGRNVRKPASPSTVNRKMATIIKMLNVACTRWRLIPAVPKIEPLKTPKLKMRGMTDQEIERIFELSPEPIKEVFRFLIETGFRRGEWAQLQWRNVDFENGFIHLDPRHMKIKASDERRVPMSKATRAILERHLEEGRSRPFAGVRVDRLRYWWDKIRHEMGKQDDPGFVIHGLRHTCATRLIENGTPTMTVQKWLGHANIQTTQRYVQQSDESLKKFIDNVAL